MDDPAFTGEVATVLDKVLQTSPGMAQAAYYAYLGGTETLLANCLTVTGL